MRTRISISISISIILPKLKMPIPLPTSLPIPKPTAETVSRGIGTTIVGAAANAVLEWSVDQLAVQEADRDGVREGKKV